MRRAKVVHNTDTHTPRPRQKDAPLLRRVANCAEFVAADLTRASVVAVVAMAAVVAVVARSVQRQHWHVVQ